MSNPELKRELGAFSAVMVTVGSVIGSGIFLKPWEVSHYLPNEFLILSCWVMLGIVCLFGGLAFAELGSMFPEAGGQYAYLREGWGSLIAFLFGWCLLLVINTGSIAALAVAFATSLGTVVFLPPWVRSLISVLMILVIALTNHFGVRWGALLQNLSTVAKLLALGAIVLAGFLVGGLTPPSGEMPGSDFAGPGLTPGLVAACVAIFWAYQGWYSLPFNAAELRNPERDLPRGLTYGILILVVTYVAVNAVYLYVVPLHEMRTLGTDIDVPRLVMVRIFGAQSANWLALLICLSVFGAANANILSVTRAFYAMAQDGLLIKALLKVHPVYRTPTVAIWSQAAWAIALVFILRTFRDLTDYVIFGALIFFALTVAAVYRLRRRMPDLPRSFRCPGYPWTPAVFIAVVIFVDVYTLTSAENRQNALFGLLIIASGIPIYYWRHGRNRGRTESSRSD